MLACLVSKQKKEIWCPYVMSGLASVTECNHLFSLFSINLSEKNECPCVFHNQRLMDINNSTLHQIRKPKWFLLCGMLFSQTTDAYFNPKIAGFQLNKKLLEKRTRKYGFSWRSCCPLHMQMNIFATTFSVHRLYVAHHYLARNTN